MAWRRVQGGIYGLRREARASFPPPPVAHRRCHASSAVGSAESAIMQLESVECIGRCPRSFLDPQTCKVWRAYLCGSSRRDGQRRRWSSELEKMTSVELGGGFGTLRIAREELGKALRLLIESLWRESGS